MRPRRPAGLVLFTLREPVAIRAVPERRLSELSKAGAGALAVPGEPAHKSSVRREGLPTAVLREMFREVVGVSSRSDNRVFLTRRSAYVLQARAELAEMTSSADARQEPGSGDGRR